MSKHIESLTSIRDYLQDRIELEKDPLFDREQAKVDVEALDMAVKALSDFPYVKYTENGMEPDFEMANVFSNANQHNSNTSHDDGQRINVLEGDAISRQAVNNLQKYKYNCGDTSITCISLKSVNDLPSVNPKPKTGEWQQDLDGTYLCSECGSGFKEQPTLMGKPMFLWCPLCGARMRSEKNE